MANSNNIIGQFAEETGEVVKETAEEVKDALGEMIEQGIQSTTSPQLTPQQFQQKQQEDQKKEQDRQKQMVYTRKWIADLAAAQQKVRMENKQKEQQRLQAQQEEAQQKKVEEIQKTQAAKKPGGTTQDAIQRSLAEYKPGKGVGG